MSPDSKCYAVVSLIIININLYGRGSSTYTNINTYTKAVKENKAMFNSVWSG